GLAAGDDGVHAWAVCIVRAWAAVAIAVQPSGVAAGPTIALARDEVGERLVTELRLRRRKRLHGPLSLPLGACADGLVSREVPVMRRTPARCMGEVYEVRPKRHKRRTGSLITDRGGQPLGPCPAAARAPRRRAPGPGNGTPVTVPYTWPSHAQHP